MFPYPSGAGLHVGHPEGYTATDILCRYKRMRGFNVLHPMGWDAFGLPAEQYAIQTNTHPRITTQANIDTFRRQIKSLGFSYDWDREVDTTDPDYYRWTQWIFLKIYDTWYDPEFAWTDAHGRIRTRQRPADRRAADPAGTRRSRCLSRLASGWPTGPRCRSTGAPAWAPCWPTKRSSTARASAADHPVVRMPLTQWMLRITAYAERLIDDLEVLDWPRPIKEMQRNWIGRSEGAEVDFPIVRRPRLAAQPSDSRGSRRRDPRLHHAARHALRRHLHGARARAPAGRSHHDAEPARRPSRAYREQAAAARATSTAPTWPRPRPASSPAPTPSTR